MDRIAKLFLLLVVVGPLHMIEQMLTSIEEFYWLRGQLEGYYAWFAPASADLATVILITVVWTKVSLALYAFLVGGTPRLVVLGLFGLFGVSELHHVIEALAKGGYEAGVVTSIPYAAVGGLLVADIVRELRRGEPIERARARGAALLRTGN
jgi:hypothetical protein